MGECDFPLLRLATEPHADAIDAKAVAAPRTAVERYALYSGVAARLEVALSERQYDCDAIAEQLRSSSVPFENAWRRRAEAKRRYLMQDVLLIEGALKFASKAVARKRPATAALRAAARAKR